MQESDSLLFEVWCTSPVGQRRKVAAFATKALADQYVFVKNISTELSTVCKVVFEVVRKDDSECQE